MALACGLFSQCSDKKKPGENFAVLNTSIPDTSNKEQAKTVFKSQQPSSKVKLKPANEETTAWLRSLMKSDSLKILLALNKVDPDHLFSIDTLVLPAIYNPDLLFYSPFPGFVATLNNVDKIILFSYPDQAFAAYMAGKLIRWGPVSMGKEASPTPTGLFFTNWKSKQTISTVDSTWIMNWYFNIDNRNGISIHEYSMPGYPASHSCIRLLKEDAYWFYNWADQWKVENDTGIVAYGTPIIIYGTYPFTGRKPWITAAENGLTANISEAALTDEINPFLPIILERQIQRDSLATKKI